MKNAPHLDEETREELDHILRLLHEEYASIAPSYGLMEEYLLNRGEELVVDHMGIRTFALNPVSMDCLETVFTSRGYRLTGEYTFPEKHLRARSFSPPSTDFPRIFLSEITEEAFTSSSWDILKRCVDTLDSEITGETLLGAQRNWPPIEGEEYSVLHKESQYAAWVASLGIRVNHVALSVNELGTLDGLEDVNEAIHQLGMSLEVTGKSARALRKSLLAQSSTQADSISHAFAGGDILQISGGYVEFAHRFRDPETGGLFDGFVTPQANAIFESTKPRG